MDDPRSAAKPPPHFFLPRVPPDKQEAAYADLARLCGGFAAPPGLRVYSITYALGGAEWTATVGQQLRVVHRRTARWRGKKVARASEVSDPATILAIFAGSPYLVVTDKGEAAESWESPFVAERPTSVSYFVD